MAIDIRKKMMENFSLDRKIFTNTLNQYQPMQMVVGLDGSKIRTWSSMTMGLAAPMASGDIVVNPLAKSAKGTELGSLITLASGIQFTSVFTPGNRGPMVQTTIEMYAFKTKLALDSIHSQDLG